MKILGTKYQTYIDDDLMIFRLVNIKSDDKFIVIDKDNKRISMTEEELNKCVALSPDAVLNVMSTSSTSTGEKLHDVYACVNRLEDMKNDNNKPVLILRQDTYSMSKNSFTRLGDYIYVGDCVTNINCADDDTFLSLLEYEKIDDTLSVALYADDKYKDIKQFIIGHNAKKFNETLCSIKISNTNEMVKGYCESLEELFEENNFMINYRAIFNITQVDFPIILDNNVSDDGVITLNNKQINRIEDILNCYITEVSALKYDKDIDISKIVEHTHIMISDVDENIYLVSYVVVAHYAIDNDIAVAMGVNK